MATGKTRKLIIWIIAGFISVAAVATGALYALSSHMSREVDKQDKCCWIDAVTFDQIVHVIGIDIPNNVTDRRSAFHSGSRWDTGLIAFTLPDEEAERYIKSAIPHKEKKLRPNSSFEMERGDSATPFGEIDLPEPEKIEANLLRTSICPDNTSTKETKNLENCVDIFVHDLADDRTRIYMRSQFYERISTPSPGTSSL